MLIKKKIKEADVQKHLLKRTEELGSDCWARKWSDRYLSNMPDYIIIYKSAVVFCELKRPGEAPRAGQKVEGWKIGKAGGAYTYCQSIEDVDRLISDLQGGVYA